MMGRKRVYGGRQCPPAKKSKVNEVAKLKRQVARLKPETKICPVTLTFTNVANTTGAVGYLSAIAQGSNETERDGNSIRPVYADIVCSTSGGSDTISSVTYSLYLIKDKQSAGSTPVVSGTANSIFVLPDPNTGIIQYNTMDRFKILKEWQWSPAMLVNGNQFAVQHTKVMLSGVTEYHDTTAAVASSGKNSYYIVALSNGAANTVDFSVFCNFAYTDV